MKKIVLFLGFCFFLLSGLYAQEMRGLRFGLQTSPQWSWLSTSDKKLEGVSSNWGVKLGMIGEYYFANNYAFTTGLGFGFNQGGFIQNGYTRGVFWDDSELSASNLDTMPLNAKLHYRLNYVEIPIGLKMRGGSNEDSRIKFYAEIPVFTLGFVSKATGDIRGTNSQNTDDENIRKDVNGLSLTWGLGGGIEYELATNATLVAGLTFQKQFTDLTDDSGTVEKSGNSWVKDKSKATFGLLAFRIGLFF
ncbi:MAG: PorT family protein [Saprospiraceae bacterium]|nr:PorT family protein [Saprospiraceae bacterium]